MGTTENVPEIQVITKNSKPRSNKIVWCVYLEIREASDINKRVSKNLANKLQKNTGWLGC